MEASSHERRQIIFSLLAQQPENIADAAEGHWEELAGEIIPIVGETGFDSLYERTLQLVHSTYPWLTTGSSSRKSSPRSGGRFEDLVARLADQEPVHACKAHSLLLTTLTDILASLVGEQLTSNILRAAWGNPASVASGKELN